jgi:hypothetical protein
MKLWQVLLCTFITIYPVSIAVFIYSYHKWHKEKREKILKRKRSMNEFIRYQMKR